MHKSRIPVILLLFCLALSYPAHAKDEPSHDGRAVGVAAGERTEALGSTPGREKTADGDEASYSVTFSGGDLSRARVTAEIDLTGDELIMEPFSADFLPEGWATYVRDLKVTDAAGKPVAFTRDNSVWTLKKPFDAPLTLEYSVDYTFGRKQWPYGNHTAAYLDEKTLFSTAKILFIHTPKTEKAAIEFHVPEKMAVSAPWVRIGDSGYRYTVTGKMNLLHNFFVVGSFKEYNEKIGNFTFRFIPMNAEADYVDTVFDLTADVIRYFLGVTKDRREAEYQFVLFEGSGEGGEAYNDGFAMVTAMHPGADNLLLWGDTVAHELFHRWNGVFPDTTEQVYYDVQWFMEGFTEYMATLSLLRSGRIDERAFLNRLEKGFEAYLLFKRGAPYESVSLQEAGKNKQATNPALYHGGSAVALCLDIMIRDKSDDRMSLEDFMGEMAQRFFNRNTQYSVEQLRDMIIKYAGEEGGQFLKNYVYGKRTILLTDYLARAGLTLMINDYFAYINAASEIELRTEKIRNGLLNSSEGEK